MHYSTRETLALHHTDNTCTTSHRKHTHYITHDSLNYITHENMHFSTQETHALHHKENTCTSLHRKHSTTLDTKHFIVVEIRCENT